MKHYSLRYHQLYFRNLTDISFINYVYGAGRLDLIVNGVRLVHDVDPKDADSIEQFINDWRELVENELP